MRWKERLCPVLALALLTVLTAFAPAGENPAGVSEVPALAETAPEAAGEDVRVHEPADGGAEPESADRGAVTTVSREAWAREEPWEASFGGGDSAALTDLLLGLDYSGGLCRCLPEYRVDTASGTDYGVNLTEGYARHDGGQADLTEEQVRQIQDILERQGA